jgi:alkanesulfonate monooxygenase SsuD/methylene tetrahydromethanopterin reductase-like flavin-dependent oxidoreductase (luciferase family)
MEQSYGFGVAGGLDPEIVRRIARQAEDLGYTTFWANDTPRGDGLATLAVAASVTSAIRLGVGLIPLDRRNAEDIASSVKDLELPVDRLTIGVGSGGAMGGLAIVREGAVAVRGATGARVVVGALGPRMTALAGKVVDGVLLNWLMPGQAERSGAIAREAAHEAGRPEPWLYGYVRTALGASASERLVSEANRYGCIPAYAAHFARMGVQPIDTAVAGDDPETIRNGLAPFAAVLDETVVRAITADESVEAYEQLLRAAAPPR